MASGSSRWSAPDGGLAPSRFRPSELSDGMIQSVKLRASGSDSFVDHAASTPHSRRPRAWTPVDRDVKRLGQNEVQLTTTEPSSSSGGWAAPTALLIPPGMGVFPSTTADNSRSPALVSHAAKRNFDGERKHGQQFALEAHDPAWEASRNTTVSAVTPLSQLPRDKSSVAIPSFPSLSPAPVTASFENSKRHQMHSTTLSSSSSVTQTAYSAGTSESKSVLEDSMAGSSSLQPAKTTTASSEGGTSAKRVRIKTERRREQCRTNQARYRNKQRAYRQDLEQAVEQLREEVAKLETRHQSLSHQQRTGLSPWNVAVEYFRLFRHGAHLVAPTSDAACASVIAGLREASLADGASSATSAVELFLQSPSGRDQLSFLQSVTVPDVYYSGGGEEMQGVEGIVKQWIRYAQCFDNFELQLERIEKAPGPLDTVVATSRVCVTISDATLRFVFPHLLNEDGNACHESDEPFAPVDGSDLELAQRLLGQRLAFKSSMRFECDPVSSKVVRLLAQIDLVTTLRRALGSLADAARVLDGARITGDGFLLVGGI